MIKVKGLDKYYNKGKPNEIHVINNTSLVFKNTGLVCILGESGSGKTTLLNTLGGLDTFQSGEIEIDGITLTKNTSKEEEKLRNAKFGYVFQEQYLLQEQSVEYNIHLALKMFDISSAEKEARVDYVLQAVDMKKYKKRIVSQLSGGQQQRIAIARALVKSPEIIFADEPTGNLDEANTMRIMSIIKKISKDCLVILVTHEKRIAEFFADRIITIKDGRVISDVGQEGSRTYEYSDDRNLYLKEFRKEELSNEKCKINYYSKDEICVIELNLVYYQGKLYIQSPKEAEVVYLTSETEMQLVNATKPEMDLKQIEEFDYSLTGIKANKRAGLSLRDIYKLARLNVKLLGIRQVFMVISFIATAILMVITLADYLSAATIDKSFFVTEDSHYISVNANRNAITSDEQYRNSFEEIYEEFQKSGFADDIYLDLNAKLTFSSNSFKQIEHAGGGVIQGMSYVTLEHLEEEDLILGRMPEQRNEIVMDRWGIDLILKHTVFGELMEPEDFIGLEVDPIISGPSMIIAGICDTGNPTIYVDKYIGISMASWADYIGSIQQLRQLIPDQYDAIALGADEALVSEDTYRDMQVKKETYFTAKNGIEYRVAGTFPEGYDMAYVIDDAYYRETLDAYICTIRKFMIYSDNKEPILNYFNQNLGNFDLSNVRLEVEDIYGQQLSEYKADRSDKLSANLIASVATFIISITMLYFTMKSNTIRRAQELTVYRLMGITRRSIIAAFVLEIILVTNATVLPAVIVLSAIIKYIAIIPALQIHIIYPWTAVVALLLFLYLSNIIAGILPVYRIVKLPPAQIATKY